MNLATVKTKRCPGWRVETYSGAPHTLPATTSYFYPDQYRKDGLARICIRCASDYGRHRLMVHREQRAARKARNEAMEVAV